MAGSKDTEKTEGVKVDIAALEGSLATAEQMLAPNLQARKEKADVELVKAQLVKRRNAKYEIDSEIHVLISVLKNSRPLEIADNTIKVSPRDAPSRKMNFGTCRCY